MKRHIDSLSTGTFDLIIIGGGIIGTGIARDAALRGIKTLLIEKEDFGYGTTSRSSRLIHGGIRYLQNMEFHLVRQDLHEREVLLHIAPHLVHPYPFIIPMTTPYYSVALRIGVPLYDLMSFDKSIPSRTYLSKQKAIALEPSFSNLPGLSGAFIYYDCQIPYTERLCIENVISASEHGATIINHASVTGFLRDGNNVCGVTVQDNLKDETYMINAKLVVNATGHWVDCIRDMLYDRPSSIVRRTKGIHLVTPKLCERGLVLFSSIDSRLFFVMPWLNYTLIGTTDTDYQGDIESIAATKENVMYMLTSVNQVFPHLSEDSVYYTMAGLRPLAHIGGEKPSQATREHKILDHKQREGIDGLVTVLGGKITAYRAVAEEAVNTIIRKLGLKVKCTTAESTLPGAQTVTGQQIELAAQANNLSSDIITHLTALYGSRYTNIIDTINKDRRLAEPICTHCNDILAQIHYAVNEESACTVADFLLRRSLSGLEKCQGLDAVDKVAAEMGHILNWSQLEQQKQIADYKVQITLTQSFRTA